MQIFPIDASHLQEVGEFLNQNLAKRISAQAWSDSLAHRWAESQPNHGMQMRDGDKLVGVFCAIYSDQHINGTLERFCNPHSWCVLDAYRSSGIGLPLLLLRQRGYHFTMFTPNPKVAKVFLGLRFRMLDDVLLYMPNLPAPLAARGGRFIETDPQRIAARLVGSALDEFNAHRSIPWLNFVAFGRDGDACLAIYKRERWKKVACTWLMSLSDPGALQRHGGLLRHHLLKCGMPVSRIEARFLADAPALALRSRRKQPKLVLSKTLSDTQVRDTYSELMSLDL
ncbi:hypothetical protein BH11PSE8_BH11PSE8_06360 [soil metagenome]